MNTLTDEIARICGERAAGKKFPTIREHRLNAMLQIVYERMAEHIATPTWNYTELFTTAPAYKFGASSCGNIEIVYGDGSTYTASNTGTTTWTTTTVEVDPSYYTYIYNSGE